MRPRLIKSILSCSATKQALGEAQVSGRVWALMSVALFCCSVPDETPHRQAHQAGRPAGQGLLTQAQLALLHQTPEPIAVSSQLGLTNQHAAQEMQQVIEAKQRQDPAGWQAFQSRAATVKLQLSRAEQQLESAAAAADAAAAAERIAGEPQRTGPSAEVRLQGRRGSYWCEHAATAPERTCLQLPGCTCAVDWGDMPAEASKLACVRLLLHLQHRTGQARPLPPGPSAAAAGAAGDKPEAPSPLAGQRTCRIVLISGFESFNTGLYRQARP